MNTGQIMRTAARGCLPSGVLFCLALGGCVARPASEPAEARALGREVPAYHAPEIEAGGMEVIPVPAHEPSGVLVLREALGLALIHHPELAVFSWEVRRAEARVLQSGLAPNPELEVEFENFAGDNAFEDDDALESTVALSQLVELGGKRMKRMRVASLEHDLASWDYEAQRLGVFREVNEAFVAVLVAQERLSLNGELVELAEQVAATVGDRVGAGRVLPVEETRVKVALSLGRIELQKAARDLDAARRTLVSAWGGRVPQFIRAQGDFESVGPIPAYEELEKTIAENPELARWASEMERRQAVLNLEQANRIPDVTISGGYRRFNETDDNALVMGFSIPLPVFNRNQGTILEAEYALAKAREQQRAANAGVRRLLIEAYRALASAHAEVTLLKDEVLPGAQSAFDDINIGYREGKFGYLEVLDAQRTLFDARGGYFDALAQFHTAVAEVESLIGEGLMAGAGEMDRDQDEESKP